MVMEVPVLKLHHDEFEKIEFILSSLRDKCSASSAFLISRSGQEVAYQGDRDSLDKEAISSLAAGNLAATFGLASLIGESGFERIYHRGRKTSLLISPVGEIALLLLVLPNQDREREAFTKLGQFVMLLRDLLERKNVPRIAN
jgi:predicted regulator of Ras-like GTPase activity (Roadblock/LC7/MglB family)